MKRNTLFALLVGSLALTFASTAVAQTDDENTEGTTVTQPAFVDADGDGICDNVAQRHAMANRALRLAHAAGMKHQRRAAMGNLTDAQRAQVQQVIADMKAGEATPEDVHAAVGQKLQEFGVTLPENWGQNFRQFAEQRRLTDEQRAEVRALVESMKAEGKARDEIHTAVAAKYEEWGRAMPERFGKGPMRQAQRSASE